MRAFRLIEQEIEPGCREIQIEGELDLSVAAGLDAVLDRCLPESKEILIGLEHCEFIDSTGIAVIVRAHKRITGRGGRLALYGASDQVLRTLEITGLTQKNLVFETMDEAR